MTDGGSIWQKLMSVFKNRKIRRSPLSKFAEEERPDSLKRGIIKKLTGQSEGIAEDLDLLVEFVELINSGGC
jgi:hypothetical protein